MQVKEVDVCFSKTGKKYTFDCSNIFAKMGEKVVVETVRGLEVGTICSHVRVHEDDQSKEPLKKILRIATPSDLEQKTENVEKAKEILDYCKQLASELNLEMKIIKADIALDMSKVVISFSSDGRVDFRELVKQLANKFKLRIELKQVDAREETKIMGGLGPCGRETCCSSYLCEPQHSSIKMAKVQGLSLNPSNISGLCGKLKCCLAYENEYYSEVFSLMPPVNTEVDTPDGKGLVVYNDLLKKVVSVKFATSDGSFNIKDFNLEEIKFENRKK